MLKTNAICFQFSIPLPILSLSLSPFSYSCPEYDRERSSDVPVENLTLAHREKPKTKGTTVLSVTMRRSTHTLNVQYIPASNSGSVSFICCGYCYIHTVSTLYVLSPKGVNLLPSLSSSLPLVLALVVTDVMVTLLPSKQQIPVQFLANAFSFFLPQSLFLLAAPL